MIYFCSIDHDLAMHTLCTVYTTILTELLVDTFQPPRLWTACGKPEVLLSNPHYYSCWVSKHFWLLMKQLLANSQTGWGCPWSSNTCTSPFSSIIPYSGKISLARWQFGEFGIDHQIKFSPESLMHARLCQRLNPAFHNYYSWSIQSQIMLACCNATVRPVCNVQANRTVSCLSYAVYPYNHSWRLIVWYTNWPNRRRILCIIWLVYYLMS
jgi:hypothetical protein